jgi:hypothetical protein
MKKRIFINLAMAIFLFGMLLNANAEYRIVVGETGIYCRSENGRITGVMCDLAEEMIKRMGYTNKMQMVPHRRLKAMMKMKATKTFYIPSSRNQSNNKDLQFVVEMLKDEYVVVTATNSTFDGSTIEAAKQFRYVSILGGSEAEEVAKHLLPNIDSSSSQEECAKKLNASHVEGWISTWNGARYTAKSLGIDPSSLKRGAKIMDANLAVFGTPDIPIEEIEKWRATFTALKADGTVNRVFKQYDIQLNE